MASEWKRDSEPETGYHLVDDRPFARGGSGEVWKAIGPGGIRVVLKRVPLAGKMAEAERKSLEVIRNIPAHPHLLGIHGFWIHDTELVIATELASGSLADRLKATGGAGIPAEELLDYMEDAAKGIDFLNSPIHQFEGKQVAVQHRDVKPDNLLLVGGSVKLGDFGLAKALERQCTSHTGVMTPAFAAPEAFQHQTSNRSDQYSLAATFVELRTGHCIFEGSVAQVMYGQVHDQPDLAGLTAAEATVVAKALAKDPADRFASCREFVSTLRRALAEHPQEISSTSVAADKTPKIPMRSETARPDSEPALGVAVAAAVAPSDSYRTTVARSDTVPHPASPPQPIAAAMPDRPASNYTVLWAGISLAVAAIAVVAILILPRLGMVKPLDQATTSIAEPRNQFDSKDARLDDRPELTTKTTRPDQEGGLQDERHSNEVPPETTQGRDADPSQHQEVAKKDTSPPYSPPTDEAKGNLAEQGYAFLKKYCYRCHGVDFKVPGYNVLDRDILVAKRGADDLPYITPGKLDESQIWQRVGEDADMPPSGAKPSDEEKDLLRKWIEAGAPFPKPEATARQFRSDKDVLASVAEHLRKTPIADRTYQRYFTLTHLHNNKTVRDDELRLYRAALAKMANSVSWKHSIVVPKAIDRAEAILNVDLRDLGWDEANLWKEILKVYPYGLKHSNDPDESMRDLAQEVSHLSGSDLPLLRADWFIATAARPPLYHTLLRLPKMAHELEQMLKVDAEADFLRNKLYRAAFATSGVSSQNRLVDRHASVYGAYWKSYDFNKSEGTGNIFQFPLGPRFTNNPFDRQAFEHAGGELIFSLPNGLHGYLLVDNKGNRIDAGPIDIVHDELKTSGTPTIVTGVSCMGCHKHGMIRFKDTLRNGHAVAGEAREKVELLVPQPDAMDKLLVKDEDQFLRALDEAAGPFLKIGDDANKNIRQFPEPVGAITRLYLKDMGPEEIACELGIPDPAQLQGAIRGNPKLRQLGLGPLMQNSKIKREAWETLKGFNSPMQDTARELELGTPFRIF